jgi:hypothetical protein
MAHSANTQAGEVVRAYFETQNQHDTEAGLSDQKRQTSRIGYSDRKSEGIMKLTSNTIFIEGNEKI